MEKKIRQQLQNKQGSALVMVLLIVTILTTIGLALMLLTFSDYTMSILYGDVDKAYFAAEAAQGMAAQAVDRKVVELQEAARMDTNQYIESLLNPPETSPLRNQDGSINQSAVETLFKSKYTEFFNARLNDPAGLFSNVSRQENLNLLMGLSPDKPVAAQAVSEDGSSQAVLETASFDAGLLTLKTAGVYTDAQKNAYKREITATYSLLPDTTKIPYQVVPRVAVVNSTNSTNFPAILTRALVAEKNLLAAGGEVNIVGDVLAFGTIPVKNGAEDMEAPWYKYGGIMAGIPDISGMDMDGAGMDFGSYFGIDTSKTGTMVSGKINIMSSVGAGISGDAATMAYLHTLYSNDDSDYSAITGQGAIYARSIKSEEPANYSVITLKDAYTTDNLQIDSNESQVNVNGLYCGFVTAGYDIDGSGLVMTDDEYRYKRTSSVVVNGDSKLYLNGTSAGGVYIGGNTFLKNYANQAFFPTENRPYMTGISAIKSSSKIAEAFKQYNALNGETRLYTGSGQYITNPAFSTYENITDPSNPAAANMLAGSDGTFKQSQRSKHFKWLWEGLWKLDNIYQRYLNSSAIQISVDPDNKITGYSFGTIAANGNVYDQSDYKGAVDATTFGFLQKNTWIRNYHDQLQPLLSDGYDSILPRLDYTANSKHIADYLQSSVLQDFSSPNLIESNGQQAVVYYCNSDCHISNSGGSWSVNGTSLPSLRGLIIANGSIYVGKGFSFTGALLSVENIVFLGNSTITYDRDLINSLLLNDQVAQLFGLKRFMIEPGSSAINEQRMSFQNIKLTDWKKNK